MKTPLIYRLLGLYPQRLLRSARAHMALSGEEVRTHQLAKLNLLISKIRATPGAASVSPWLKEVRGSLHSIEEFSAIVPALEKADLQQRRIEAGLMSRFRTIHRETAGTTGQVTRVVLSREVLAAQLAVRALSLEWHGLSLGDREGRIWGRRSHQTGTTLLERALRRRVVGLIETDDERRQAVHSLQEFDPAYLYGYSSQVLALAPFVAQNLGGFASLRAVFCTAESLLDWQRDQIESFLRVPVVREYGCTEVDIIAVECPRRHYHIMIDRCIVERATEPGSEGEILVTDLDNFEFPIVRYRLGDVVQLGESRCDCGMDWPTIETVEGRSADRYVVLESGRLIHAVTFAHMVESMVATGIRVRQFRVTQSSSKRLHVGLNLYVESQRASAEELARNWISRKLDARLEVDFTIGPLPSMTGHKSHYFQPLSVQAD